MARLDLVVKLDVLMIFLVLSETFRQQTTEYMKVKKPYDPEKNNGFICQLFSEWQNSKKYSIARSGFFTILKAFNVNLDSHSFIS